MNYGLVGAFVLVLGALLIGGVLWIASGGEFNEKYDRYLAIEDESVSGLNLNAPVKYNGVEVGKVREIHLDAHNPERVRVVFSIERGTPVNADTVATLKTQGLTGIAFFELTGGNANSAPLRVVAPERYPVIKTEPSLSARIENVLTKVMGKVDNTSDTVNSLLSDKNRAAFTAILSDLSTVMHTLAERKDTLDRGIASAAKTFDNTSQLTEQLGPVITQIGKTADSLEKMGNDVSSAGNSIGKTVDSVGPDVKRFARDALPQIQNLLADLDVLSASLRRLSENIERNPSSLLRGDEPVPPGPGEKGNKGAPK